MSRDAVVFWGCMFAGACSVIPELPERNRDCNRYAENAEHIRRQGAPLNVGNEWALAENERQARAAGCR